MNTVQEPNDPPAFNGADEPVDGVPGPPAPWVPVAQTPPGLSDDSAVASQAVNPFSDTETPHEREVIERSARGPDARAEVVEKAFEQLATQEASYHGLKRTRVYCPGCRAWGIGYEKKVWHLAHGVVTFVFFPPWCVIWLILGIFPSYCCPTCHHLAYQSDSKWAPWLHGRFVSVILLLTCVAIGGTWIWHDMSRRDAAEKSYSRGVMAMESGQLAEAHECFEEVLEVKPREAGAWFNLGLIQAQLGDFEQAIASYKKAIDSDSDGAYDLQAEAEHQLGHCAFKLGKIDEALNYLTRSINSEPTNAEYWTCRGEIHAGNEETAAAIADYERAFSIEPNADRLIELCNLYCDAREMEKALRLANEDLQSDHAFPLALAARANIYCEQEEYERAVQDYDECLRQLSDPSSKVSVLLRLAHCYLLMNRFALAEDSAGRAIKLSDQDGWAYYLRAYARAQMGAAEAAKADLSIAMELDGQSDSLRQRLLELRQNLEDERFHFEPPRIF